MDLGTRAMTWLQHYDPLNNVWFSTSVAALPVVVLLSAIAVFRIRIHLAAVLGLAVALAVALFAYRMPVQLAFASAVYGAAYGLFPIGWIILNLIFLYQLTVESGRFEVLRASLATLAPDPRIQVIVIAFCFGAFFEGAAGFGTPVAVTAAILMGLGFKPLEASALSLIANTAPVAYGSLGTPIIALNAVTGIDVHKLSAMVGRQLPFFSMIVPFWVVAAMSGWRGVRDVWPAALTAGVAFAIPQFLVSNFHGPWLVDVIASVCSMGAVALLLLHWKPATAGRHGSNGPQADPPKLPARPKGSDVIRAWMPWIVLSAFLFFWGLPGVKTFLNGERTVIAAGGQTRTEYAMTRIDVSVPRLHLMVQRTPPVAPVGAPPEKAVYSFNWLSASGTGILFAALLSGCLMGLRPSQMAAIYWRTIVRVRFSLLTIMGMLAIGYVTKYSGTDATLGLALARTGGWYPFFGTLLGWLGVALTGSDTASNVLFGGLQKITAEQTQISPVLMCSANSSGGVMGKMIDAQSIVVASTATNYFGGEGAILRYVFFHSIALACLVGVLVYLQARVEPFASMVVR